MLLSLTLSILGALLVGLALLDVALTVLHPETESPYSSRLHAAVWAALRLVARPLRGRRRHQVLAGAIPLMIMVLLSSWILLLLVGFGLLYAAWLDTPGAFHLPDGTRAGDGLLALYFSGVTLGTIGYGDIQPVHPWLRLLSVVEGVSGLIVLSLTVAYVLELYPVLQRKRVLAVLLNEETAGHVHALPLLARYLRHGNAAALMELLRGLNLELLALAEAHRRLPVLHYAHPTGAEGSLLRILLVVQHLVGALRYGLAGGEAAPWREDPRVCDLEDSFFYTLYTLGSSLPLVLASTPEQHRQRQGLVAAFEELCDGLERQGLPTPSREPALPGRRSAFEEACAGFVRFRLASDPALGRYQHNSGYSRGEALRTAERPQRLVSDQEHGADR